MAPTLEKKLREMAPLSPVPVKYSSFAKKLTRRRASMLMMIESMNDR